MKNLVLQLNRRHRRRHSLPSFEITVSVLKGE